MTTGCTCNGLGDRLSQFKNGVATLNAGLTQVLQDGANTYLYGVNRIAQVAETQTGYFLPDAPPQITPSPARTILPPPTCCISALASIIY